MWENVPSDIEKTVTVSPLAKSEEITPNLMIDIDRVVQEIEKRGIDIAPDYDTWLNVGFALADGLGINGCEVFHRISRLHHDYDYVATNQQYRKCLNGNGTGVTVASFFHYAAQAGIELSHRPSTILPKCQNGKTVKWMASGDEMLHFPKVVYDTLPPFLAKVVCNAISEEDRDVILLGSMGCLSVCFNNVRGVYDERIVFPNLYLSECGLGYRVDYVLSAVECALNGSLEFSKLEELDDESLFLELKKIKGVGDKVANCVMLFAYHRIGRAPVDTWILKVINEQYGGVNPFDRYGNVAGVMQQYVFYYVQNRKGLS